MTEIERLKDQLERSWNGDAWHGPPLRDVLVGIDAGTAAARPIDGAHSIWELALHVAGWQERARRRLEGDPAPAAPDEDWPAAPDAPGGAEADGDSEVVSGTRIDPEAGAARARTLEALEASRRRLLDAVGTLDDVDLDAPAAGGAAPYVLVHGVIQHDLYHAGQIALLRKAVRARG